MRISRREKLVGRVTPDTAPSRVWLSEEAISQPALQVAPGCLPIDPQLHPERHDSPVFISDMEAERGGRVKSHHIPSVNAATLRPILTAQVNAATFVMTDEGGAAKKVGGEFSLHGSVNHSVGEYVRGDIHTNTIEGYFSILKRGINGVYHHVSQNI